MNRAAGGADAVGTATQDGADGCAAWRISIDGLLVQAYVGMYAHEFAQAQSLMVDVQMAYRQPVGDDQGVPPVDYDRYCNMVSGFLQQRPHARLLETLVADIASLSFDTLPAITDIQVSLHKPGIRADAARLGVSLAWRRQDYHAHRAAHPAAHAALRATSA